MDDTKEAMLTTTDNPYNPFTQFDDWYRFDSIHGYNTLCYLARIAHVSDELSEEDYNAEVNRAINDVLKYDPLPVYVKVYKTSS